MRGGVSISRAAFPKKILSSPRAWGCFYQPGGFPEKDLVFPTCVGVFPLGIGFVGLAEGLPHVRGGVSDCSGKNRYRD